MEESGTDVAGDDCSEVDACHLGRVSEPTASRILKGAYGDKMEIYPYLRDNVIEDTTYCTGRNGHTRACALALASWTKGKSVMGALAIALRDIIDLSNCFSEEVRLCAAYSLSALCSAPLRITS